MADRETQVTFEDEDGLVTETDTRDTRDGSKERDGAKEGDSSETTSADPGYDWGFPATTIEGTVAPAETAAVADNSELPKDPTVAEVFAAAHQAALRGEEIQDGSPLDIAMKAAMEEIATGSNLGENPTPTEVFSQMRSAELLGLEVPADSPLQQAMDKVMDHIQTGDYLGDNPAPEAVFGAMRQAELLGLEVAPDSPLQQAMDKVMDHIQTGDYLGDNPAPEAVLGAMRQAELLGLEVAPDSPLQQAMDKVMDQIQTGSTLGPNPSAADVLGAARQAELLGLTPPPESPLAMAMANLTGSTGGIGTSSPTGSPPPGGMTSSGGTSSPTTQTTPGSPNNDTTEPPVDRSDLTGTETDPGGSGSTGSPGAGSTTPTAGTGAEYSYTSPMGTTGVLHADGTQTITDAAGNVVPPGGGSKQPPEEEEEDPPPEDEDDGGAEGDDDEDDEDDSGSDGDEEDDGDEPDDESDEGMRDPDAGGGSTMGVSSGEVGALTDSIFGSSTHGGATDGPRPDMENGLGTITGELRVTNKAGPDVDPDSDAAGGFSGTVTGPPPDSGFTDGPRPELDEFIAKPDGPPKDDGVDPYAATESDGTGPASGGTREGGAPPPPPGADKDVMGSDTVSSGFSGTLSPGGNPPSGGGTFTHEIDATAPDFSAAQMDVAIANPSLDMDDNAPPDDGFDQDADAGFGGPLDDDFT